MPLQQTSGNSTTDAYAGGVALVPNYIEDVFSTYLYTGNGSTQTITNGIDLAGKGGLVWLKARNYTQSHGLFDTARGENPYVDTDLASGQFNGGNGVVYNSTGFTNKATSYFGGSGDGTGKNYVSWTFRKQPKFFDVVTYTGNGANRTIAHSLGSVPGCIIVKRTDTTGDWQVYHQSLANTEYMVLNSIAAKATGATRWNSTTPTSTVFSLGTDASVNASGGTYVAYLFAHNAGGFGATGTDNVISCGSLTAPTSGNTTSVNLGYEPQWILVKDVTSGGAYWVTVDNMRGASVTSNAYLYPNTSGAEGVYGTSYITPTATGFTMKSDFYTGGNSVIYIAIRRGPMKVPTDGTKVFSPTAMSGTYPANTNYVTTGFPVDWTIDQYRLSGAPQNYASTRLTNATLFTQLTNAESTVYGYSFASNTGVQRTNSTNVDNTVNWSFQRAPGFFDVVCYTGTGTATTVAHNLGVAPELMIAKGRSSVNNWIVYSAPVGNTKALILNGNNVPITTVNWWNNTSPTPSVFSLGGSDAGNLSDATQVAYLFATCPGVSKVGSYTGTGATQTIACGFAGGARFVLIKRTDSTGDWYVWDTARGMVAGTDPSLLLNSSAAEVNANSIYTATTGFQIVSTAAGINASGGSYIFLAIA